MLDIVLFAFTPQPTDLPTSQSINQVKSVAMSNSDGFTPNNLLQQMSGTKVVDEDLDLELSDEESELIAGSMESASSYYSDIIVRGRVIIDYPTFRRVMQRYNEHGQITYILNQFRRNGYNISRLVAAEIWQQIRHITPIQAKQIRGGFSVDLRTGRLSYRS